MKKLYVVGNKASESLSPFIFNYWFKKYKINAIYKYLEINNKNFDKEIAKTLKEDDLLGLNITIPFKYKIIKHLDKLDIHSTNIKAVNCVSIKNKIVGYNTDWKGYLLSLPKGFKIKNKRVVIIGYGGAAKSIHYLFHLKKARNLIIFNRTKKMLKFSNKKEYTKSQCNHFDKTKDIDLIINTTPINPLKTKNIKNIEKKTIISDIVYKPKETNFLKRFPNNKKIYGISMLLQQAAPCFKIWFGFTPEIDKKLIKLLDKKI